MTGLTPRVLPVHATDGRRRACAERGATHRGRAPTRLHTWPHASVTSRATSRNVAFSGTAASLRRSKRPILPQSTLTESFLLHVCRSNHHAHTAPNTVGWIAIIIFVFLAGLGTIAALASVARVQLGQRGLKPPSNLTNYVLPEETIVYDRTGKIELARFGDAKREVVTFEEIPKVLLDATTAVEDKTFWENAGFDPVAIVSASLASLRGDSRGASTITQQLVRNTPARRRTSSRTRTGRPSASSRRSSSRSGSPSSSRARRASSRSSPPISTRTTTATRATG